MALVACRPAQGTSEDSRKHPAYSSSHSEEGRSGERPTRALLNLEVCGCNWEPLGSLVRAGQGACVKALASDHDPSR